MVFAGVIIADSKRVMLLHEFGRLPVFYFPLEDVRMDVLEASEHRIYSPLKGEASYWTVRVGDRSAEHAAWSYPQPLPFGQWLGIAPGIARRAEDSGTLRSTGI